MRMRNAVLGRGRYGVWGTEGRGGEGHVVSLSLSVIGETLGRSLFLRGGGLVWLAFLFTGTVITITIDPFTRPIPSEFPA